MPYGRSSVEIPGLTEPKPDIITYRTPDASAPPQDLVRRALDLPIGAPALRDRAAGRKNAVILVSDGSRLTPTRTILPVICEELRSAGLAPGQITVIVALGAHRKHTEQELEQLVGADLYRRIRVLNHSALPEDCVRVGRTSRGVPVEINRLAVEANLLIATGSIEPHSLAGMSGGAKALFPGVASRRSIEANHALSRDYGPDPGNCDHPVRRDLEEALGFVPVHYILNVVTDHHGRILDAVAGDPVLAHRAGAQRAAERFFVPCSKSYDQVLVSPGGHPKDQNVYQMVKSLQNAAAITRPGGDIFCVAECGEGIGNGVLQQWIETYRDRETMVRQLNKTFVLGAHKISVLHQILQGRKVYLYSRLPEAHARLLGFEPVSRPEEIAAWLRGGPPGSVRNTAVMPYGGLTFPYIQTHPRKEDPSRWKTPGR